jgi:hypothetical protein
MVPNKSKIQFLKLLVLVVIVAEDVDIAEV